MIAQYHDISRWWAPPSRRRCGAIVVENVAGTVNARPHRFIKTWSYEQDFEFNTIPQPKTVRSLHETGRSRQILVPHLHLRSDAYQRRRRDDRRDCASKNARLSDGEWC